MKETSWQKDWKPFPTGLFVTSRVCDRKTTIHNHRMGKSRIDDPCEAWVSQASPFFLINYLSFYWKPWLPCTILFFPGHKNLEAEKAPSILRPVPETVEQCCFVLFSFYEYDISLCPWRKACTWNVYDCAACFTFSICTKCSTQMSTLEICWLPTTAEFKYKRDALTKLLCLAILHNDKLSSI